METQNKILQVSYLSYLISSNLTSLISSHALHLKRNASLELSPYLSHCVLCECISNLWFKFLLCCLFVCLYLTYVLCIHTIKWPYLIPLMCSLFAVHIHTYIHKLAHYTLTHSHTCAYTLSLTHTHSHTHSLTHSHTYAYISHTLAHGIYFIHMIQVHLCEIIFKSLIILLWSITENYIYQWYFSGND